jgi:hypothetical protein
MYEKTWFFNENGVPYDIYYGLMYCALFAIYVAIFYFFIKKYTTLANWKKYYGVYSFLMMLAVYLFNGAIGAIVISLERIHCFSGTDGWVTIVFMCAYMALLFSLFGLVITFPLLCFNLLFLGVTKFFKIK